MDSNEFQDCLTKGGALVEQVSFENTNVIGFGEMGIGNTSSSSMLMSYFCEIPIKDCVGKGTGLNNKELKQKIKLLEQAKAFHNRLRDTKDIFMTFAGFEMAQMCGAMLESYDQNMIILVDGFISTAVFMAAYKLNDKIINNAIFCHQSDEKGHALLLKQIGAEPILNLGLRLGEGTGCALAYPLIQSAVNFLNDMASFESASVSEKV